jgi:hypothetical protein
MGKQLRITANVRLPFWGAVAHLPGTLNRQPRYLNSVSAERVPAFPVLEITGTVLGGSVASPEARRPFTPGFFVVTFL